MMAMKLNEHFIVHTDDGETLLVPTAEAGFSGIVRGNRTLGAILDLLSSEVTEEEIIFALSDRFDADEGVIEQDVRATLQKLRSIGAIDE